LEHNLLSSWTEIQTLSHLAISHLYLNNNPLKSITDPHLNSTKTDFSELKSLHLHYTSLDSWQSVHFLNNFYQLVEIRIKSLPILGDEEDFQAILTARLGKVKVLNGSKLSERRRLDAELYYLNQAYKEKDAPDFSEKHPRYPELVQLHGEPTPVPVSLTSNFLKDRMLELTIVYKEQKITKKVLGTLKVKALKLLASKLLRLEASIKEFICKESKQVLEDDWKELSWYDVESGQTLQVIVDK
jgi:hypothetical protein